MFATTALLTFLAVGTPLAAPTDSDPVVVVPATTESAEPAPAPVPVAPPKWDCLGGVCLNAKATSTTYPKAVVTASAHKWTRTVEVCSGRVVEVHLATGWHQPRFKWSDLLPGTSSSTGDDDGSPAYGFYEQVLAALVGKGWVLDGAEAARGGTHPGFKGERLVFALPSDEDSPPGWRGWVVGLTTKHPDRAVLCKSKFEQGL